MRQRTALLYGAALRFLRLSSQLKVKQVAQRVRLSRAAISGHELGDHLPHRSNLKRLVQAYGVSMSQFERMVEAWEKILDAEPSEAA